MAGLTAEQIIERIADANGAEPSVMRRQIEQTLRNLIADPARACAVMSDELRSGNRPTVDEWIVALEYELYDAMMPRFPGWEWDGEGYWNIRLLGERQ